MPSGSADNRPTAPSTEAPAQNPAEANLIAVWLLIVRSVVGGVLMGLANLVPGISGGTMLVASGIYTRFITAIAELTTFKPRFRSLIVLGTVVIAAVAAIVTLAGPVKDLVIDHRWVMYSLFIGLTLGGVPVVWKMARPGTPGLWSGAVVGFGAMAMLAVAQQYLGGDGTTAREGWVMMFIAGLAGASAMILPGLSGGYLLLVLGVYVPILAAIDQCRSAVQERALAELTGPMITVVLPVGLGVVVGVVVVSNLLRWLLRKHAKPTLGVLLGLLVGAVVGLWPFQQSAPVEQIRQVKGQSVIIVNDVLVFEHDQTPVEAEDLPTVFFRPAAGQVAGSIGLIVAGFAATALIARLGNEKPKSRGRITSQ
jgi:putative membrane protein